MVGVILSTRGVGTRLPYCWRCAVGFGDGIFSIVPARNSFSSGLAASKSYVLVWYDSASDENVSPFLALTFFLTTTLVLAGFFVQVV